MIDVKIIKKPKSGNSKSTIRVGGGFSSSGMAEEAKHANSADKANYADKAGHSDSAGYANQAGQSTRANYADVAEDISESSPIYDRFLRKDIDDTARGLITFLKGLVAQAVSYFKGIANTGDITNTGNFRNDGNISNTGDITNKGNFRNDGNITNTGDIVTRNLRVTEKASFFQLEIQKAKAAGGMTVHSAGTFHIDAVEEATDTDGYVCYQRAEQDGVKLSQMCEVSDQMMCSNGMNILKGGNGNHFYWRKVTEAPKEVVTHVINGKEEKCLKIVLSKIDHSDNTVDIPQVGDDLVQIGNPDNKERQSVIMTCAYNSFDPDLETPYWVQYTGVNDYKLETHKRTWFARNGSHVTGNFKVQSDNGGEESIEDYMKGLASKNIALSYKLIPISENALAYFTEDKKEKKVALKLKYKIQKSIGGQVSFTTLTAEGMTLTLQPSVDMLFKYDKGAYSLEKSGMVYVEIPDNSYIVTLTKGSNIVDQRIVPITFKPKVVFDIDTELGKVSSDISTVDGRVSSFEQDIEKTKSTVGNLSKDFTQIKQTSEEISLTVNNGTRPNLLWGSDLNLDGVQDKIELAYDQGGIIKQKTAEKEDLQRQLDATPTYDTSRRNELQSRIDACNDDIITARNRVNECKAAIEKHLGVGLGDTILSSTHFKYLKGQGINGSDALYFKCDPQDNNVLYLGTFWERSVGGLRNIKVKRNTKYTVSVWIKYASRDDGKWGACYCEAHAKNSDTDGNRRASYTVEDAYQTEPVEEWTRREFKFTTGEYDYAAVNILTASAGIREMWLCRPKLEESDKATPWCEYDGTVEGLRRTGINIETGEITLDAKNTIVKENLTTKRLLTTPTYAGGPYAEIYGSEFLIMYGDRKKGAQFGIGDDGLLHLIFFDANGKAVGDLGPGGWSKLIDATTQEKWTDIKLENITGEKDINVVRDVMDGSTPTYYRFTAARNSELGVVGKNAEYDKQLFVRKNDFTNKIQDGWYIDPNNGKYKEWFIPYEPLAGEELKKIYFTRCYHYLSGKLQSTVNVYYTEDRGILWQTDRNGEPLPYGKIIYEK